LNKLRIFLAEDHLVMREGLKLLINAQPDMEVIGEAANGVEAFQAALELVPDVVVMDVSMPELSGAHATRRVKEKSQDIKVLALTVHEDSGYLKDLLKAGASGYVLKRAAADELIQAIRIVAAGGVYLDPYLSNRPANTFVRNFYEASPSRENTLSLREREVMMLIAKGYSNREIAVQLDLSVKTVETYKYRGMEKLGLNSRADVVHYVLQQGWLKE
jgi:DNA-binding NarL/FixJ family response regulator